MSGTIAGGLVIAVMLVVITLLSNAAVTANGMQSVSARDAWQTEKDKEGGAFSITSTSALLEGGDTAVTVTVRNQGSVSYGEFEAMDVMVRYVSSGDTQEVKRLTHVDADPGVDEWAITSLAPDALHPGMWDPGETATLSLKVTPPAKAGTNGTVVLVAPLGTSDSAYFGN